MFRLSRLHFGSKERGLCSCEYLFCGEMHPTTIKSPRWDLQRNYMNGFAQV